MVSNMPLSVIALYIKFPSIPFIGKSFIIHVMVKVLSLVSASFARSHSPAVLASQPGSFKLPCDLPTPKVYGPAAPDGPAGPGGLHMLCPGHGGPDSPSQIPLLPLGLQTPRCHPGYRALPQGWGVHTTTPGEASLTPRNPLPPPVSGSGEGPPTPPTYPPIGSPTSSLQCRALQLPHQLPWFYQQPSHLSQELGTH